MALKHAHRRSPHGRSLRANKALIEARINAGLTPNDLAARAGLKYDRFRAAMRDPRVPPPSLDELLAAAAAAGVPDRFATHGWEPTLEQRVAELEELMRDTRLTLLARELPGSGRGRRPSRDRDNGVGDLAPGDPAEPS